MERGTKLTKEEIFAAADRLQAEGVTPRVADVHKALGRGSLTTITAAVREWREQQKPAVAPQRESAPQAIVDRLVAFGDSLWALAMETANESLAKDREALEAAKVEMHEQHLETAEYADALAEDVERLKTQVDDLTFSLETERIAHEGTRQLLTVETDELVKLRSQHELATARLEDATTRAEKLEADREKYQEEATKSGREVVRLNGLVETLEQKTESLRESVRLHHEERQQADAEARKANEDTQAVRIEAAQLRGEVETLKAQLAQQAEMFKQLSAKPASRPAKSNPEAKGE